MDFDFTFSLQVSNPSAACQSIHDWHFEVHQDEREFHSLIAATTIIPQCCLSQEVKRFHTVIGDMDSASNTAKLFAQHLLVNQVILNKQDMIVMPDSCRCSWL